MQAVVIFRHILLNVVKEFLGELAARFERNRGIQSLSECQNFLSLSCFGLAQHLAQVRLKLRGQLGRHAS
jgi:hypothetical protein